MLYQRLHVVIIHRLFFSWYSFYSLVVGWIYGYVVGCPTIHFYHIELHIQEYISEMKNGTLVKTTLFIALSQPTTNQ